MTKLASQSVVGCVVSPPFCLVGYLFRSRTFEARFSFFLCVVTYTQSKLVPGTKSVEAKRRNPMAVHQTRVMNKYRTSINRDFGQLRLVEVFLVWCCLFLCCKDVSVHRLICIICARLSFWHCGILQFLMLCKTSKVYLNLDNVSVAPGIVCKLFANRMHIQIEWTKIEQKNRMIMLHIFGNHPECKAHSTQFWPQFSANEFNCWAIDLNEFKSIKFDFVWKSFETNHH